MVPLPFKTLTNFLPLLFSYFYSLEILLTAKGLFLGSDHMKKHQLQRRLSKTGNYLPPCKGRSVRPAQAYYNIRNQILDPRSAEEPHPPSPCPEIVHSIEISLPELGFRICSVPPSRMSMPLSTDLKLRSPTNLCVASNQQTNTWGGSCVNTLTTLQPLHCTILSIPSV